MIKSTAVYPRIFLLIVGFLLWATKQSFAQTVSETIPAGSYIIDMGVEPQTADNALKPYGLIWELLNNHHIPIKWVINPGKVKDGIDFTYNGMDFKGGPFIISADSRSSEVNKAITNWETRGVVGLTTTSSITVPVYRTLNYSMNWTLDLANGQIAKQYLDRAGIPESAYNWILPEDLNCCNDVFVIPHAHPDWENHNNLLYWNNNTSDGGCGGAIWTGCKSGSETENIVNPSNNSERLNFLMEDPLPPETAPAVWANQHRNTKPPYTHQHHDHPIMQFLGKLDGAQENGAEQVYLPTNAWRPSTFIGVFDPDQGDIPSKSSGPAAKLAFGYAFGDTTRGYVVYEAAHNLDNGGEPENIAAQRAFLNFSFMAVGDKAIQPLAVVPPTMTTNASYNLSSSASGGSGSYIFEWTSTCGGTFSNPFSANTSFIAPDVIVDTECQIKLIVTDDCGTRTGFNIVQITIISGPSPPIAIDDYASTAPCNPLLIDVMQNDYDPNLDTISISILGSTDTGNGTFSLNPDGTINYVSNPGFSGIDQINYQICDNTSPGEGGPLCDVATIYVTVSSNSAPIALPDSANTFSNTPVTIDVKNNDTDAEGGILTVTLNSFPNNGSVVLTDGEFTYTPDLGFFGVDKFAYQICDNACLPLCAIDTVSVSINCVSVPDQNTIVGMVYHDIDLSSSLSTNDVGQDSIVVNLYEDNAPIGTRGPEDIFLDTKFTDQMGNYRFDLNLDYIIAGTPYQQKILSDSDDAREK